MAKALETELGWIANLPNVGPGILRFIDDEVACATQIATLQSEIEKYKAMAEAIRREAQKTVAAQWGKDQINAAVDAEVETILKK